MQVLDADQAAFPDFLTNILPCMDAGLESDNVALVQSPQVFEGVHPIYDVFAHQNVEFWSTLMVAYNTTGFISCAGTNFAVRAAALRALGTSRITPRRLQRQDIREVCQEWFQICHGAQMSHLSSQLTVLQILSTLEQGGRRRGGVELTIRSITTVFEQVQRVRPLWRSLLGQKTNSNSAIAVIEGISYH